LIIDGRFDNERESNLKKSLPRFLKSKIGSGSGHRNLNLN
jgi:hypothetical protein